MMLNPNAMAAHAASQSQQQHEQERQQPEASGPVKLFVGQVPGVCTEEMLQPLFQGFGNVLEVSIMRDKTTNRSKGSAWVVYEDRTSAETAIQMLHDQHIIPPQTNPLQIKFANSPPQLQNKQQNQNNPFWHQQQVIQKQLNYLNKFGGHSHPSRGGRKLFVGQIPRGAKQEELQAVMGRYGTVEEVCILKDKATGQGKGCAFVVYSCREEAVHAIAELHGRFTMEPMQNPMQVSHAEGELEQQEPKLFVGMVPYKSTEQEIQAVFEHYGEIVEVALLRGQNGASRGCAFVKYKDMGAAQQAVQNLHGNFKMEGGTSALTVKFADSEKEKKKRQKLKQVLGQLQTLGTQMQYPPQQQPGFPMMPGMMQPGMMMPGMMMGMMQMQGMHGQQQQQQQGQQQPGGGQLVKHPGGGSVTAAAGMTMPPGGKGGMMMPPGPAACGGPPGMGSQSGSGKASGPPGANIFILHLPLHWTDGELEHAFSPFGTIISATVFKDRMSNQSKGFGFVSYADPAAAQQAIQAMNGYQIPGHTTTLKVQLKNNDKVHRGGGGGGPPGPGPMMGMPGPTAQV
eukprot:TRINITY_DN1257_c2_g1_i1.p1 TRINITY_DN1257_c2_g1~~TRINITY_DN1257_c2_g1_i1.p1  ORF type:complete len:568 (+),score=243.82 TRINITY_DN1257_c2_g1_i1:243-1946(+)